MEQTQTQRDQERMPVEDVISRNRGLLYYIIRPIVSDENLVDDCFSVICEIILRNYDRYDPEKGSLTAWLTKVARNGALNFIQNKKYTVLAAARPQRDDGAEDDGDFAEHEAVEYRTPEDHLIEKETLRELENALATLDRLEAKILLRKYYYMQSTQQIGAELGLSERAVEGRLYRIKKKLIKKMGGENHG